MELVLLIALFIHSTWTKNIWTDFAIETDNERELENEPWSKLNKYFWLIAFGHLFFLKSYLIWLLYISWIHVFLLEFQFHEWNKISLTDKHFSTLQKNCHHKNLRIFTIFSKKKKVILKKMESYSIQSTTKTNKRQQTTFVISHMISLSRFNSLSWLLLSCFQPWCAFCTNTIYRVTDVSPECSLGISHEAIFRLHISYCSRII